MKRLPLFMMCFACYSIISILMAQGLSQPAFATTLKPQSQHSQQSGSWDGIWFSCEFAQRQRAPDEGCQMFDDEGFSYFNGHLSYVRMLGSQETACRGNKIGQCFKRTKPAIIVSQKDIGQARIENDRLIVRYWGCEQRYQLFEGVAFMTIKPLGKSCIWSQERHVYIAAYQGHVSYQ